MGRPAAAQNPLKSNKMKKQQPIESAAAKTGLAKAQVPFG
jgi:hypothetical protein